MAGGNDHLYLFVDGQKQSRPGSRRVVEILVKDDDDNILSTIRENVTLADKNLQDYSALLLALKKAKGMGASRVTLFLNNPDLCSQLSSTGLCPDHMMKGFHEEAKKLIELFESVTVKMLEEHLDSREFHA